MELIIFSILSGLGLSFILAGAISKDRINLIPGSALILLLGLLLVTGTPIKIQDGVEYTYKEVDNSTVVDTEKNVYKDYNPSNIDKNRFSELLGLTMIAISLYYFLISLSNLNFRSVMKRK